MSAGVSLRPAEARDIPQLVELNAQVQADHVDAEPAVFKPSRAGEVAAWFSDALAGGSPRVWVAVTGEELAGYVVVLPQERPEHPFAYARSWWEVDQLGVRSECRGRGVARALLAAVAAAALDAGVGELELTTWTFNAGAQEAWVSLGFEPRVIRFAIDARQLGARLGRASGGGEHE